MSIPIRILEQINNSELNAADFYETYGQQEVEDSLKNLKKSGGRRVREFYLVDDRRATLDELQEAGYFFGGFWYERPVSPKRYYKKVHFDEAACPTAVKVSQQIINLPTYYSESDLALARIIIEKHLIEEEHD